MAYATSLENFMRQELRNFDMWVISISSSMYTYVEIQYKYTSHFTDLTLLKDIHSCLKFR